VLISDDRPLSTKNRLRACSEVSDGCLIWSE